MATIVNSLGAFMLAIGLMMMVAPKDGRWGPKQIGAVIAAISILIVAFASSWGIHNALGGG